MILQPGDELRTDAVSRALLRFADGSEVIVEPGTIVTISSLALKIGQILASARRAFRVQTAYVTAGVEGTKYQLGVDGTGQVSLAVAEGAARLSSNTAAWGDVPVRVGERALARGRELPRKEALSREELERIRRAFEVFDTFFRLFLIDAPRPPDPILIPRGPG
jgi:ferric-dicitrate binding protein FerR (iron transport regulator)